MSTSITDVASSLTFLNIATAPAVAMRDRTVIARWPSTSPGSPTASSASPARMPPRRTSKAMDSPGSRPRMGWAASARWAAASGRVRSAAAPPQPGRAAPAAARAAPNAQTEAHAARMDQE